MVAQAVVQFQELNRISPQCMTALQLANPDESDEQCVYRQVWQYVQSALAERPAEAHAIRQRLKAEQIDAEHVANASRVTKVGLH